jgi:3-hydroxy-9,10-secoandrosta-1,3,5(10)-triene-9,17-dione monooxygenase reductase component
VKTSARSPGISRTSERELGECGSQRPLLFYRGRYATLAEYGGPPEVVETLLAWPRHADWM